MKPVRIGCSGWNYKHWRNGVFYPPRLPPRRWLEFYARHFDTVEVNSTFYRLPRARARSPTGFARRPPGFVFAVKMSRYADAHQAAARASRRASSSSTTAIRAAGRVAEARPGPLAAAAGLPARRRAARGGARAAACRAGTASSSAHESWFVETVYELLRAHGVALVIGDTPERAVPDARAHGRLDVRRFHYGHARARRQLLGARAGGVGAPDRRLGRGAARSSRTSTTTGTATPSRNGLGCGPARS